VVSESNANIFTISFLMQVVNLFDVLTVTAPPTPLPVVLAVLPRKVAEMMKTFVTPLSKYIAPPEHIGGRMHVDT